MNDVEASLIFERIYDVVEPEMLIVAQHGLALCIRKQHSVR